LIQPNSQQNSEVRLNLQDRQKHFLSQGDFALIGSSKEKQFQTGKSNKI
jgi:hypothetical protein